MHVQGRPSLLGTQPRFVLERPFGQMAPQVVGVENPATVFKENKPLRMHGTPFERRWACEGCFRRWLWPQEEDRLMCSMVRPLSTGRQSNAAQGIADTALGSQTGSSSLGMQSVAQQHLKPRLCAMEAS